MKLKIQNELPDDYRPYTDKYFTRTKEILEKEDLNPQISLKVFARGKGKVAGINETLELFKKYVPDLDGEIWVTKKETYETKDPLMIIKGPAQELVELETMYLGVLSHHLSQSAETPEIDTEKVKEKFSRLSEIYEEIPITYFGARHYHWSLDKKIAEAALEGGAVTTSTDIGSSNIGKKGVGTTPHFAVLLMASKYGKENATLETAKAFDRYIDPVVPRVTLVDTFNKEIDDTLSVARYFGERKADFRIDTCGENVGQFGTPYPANGGRDPTYRIGKGVTIETAKNIRLALIDEGFADTKELFLSSGFGNEYKAKAFMEENKLFKKETGYNLFSGVGIGEVSEARFATSDIFEIDRKPFSKTGREVLDLDYSSLRRVI